MNVRIRETLLRAARIGLAIAIVCSLFAAMPATPVKAESRIYRVGPGEEFPNILSALKWAGPNTVIHVKAGTYYEYIDLSQMGFYSGGTGNLAIISIDGPGKVTIAGSGEKIFAHKNFSGSLWLDGIKFSSNSDSVIALDSFNDLLMTDCTIENSGDTTLDDSDAIDINISSGKHNIALLNTTVNNFVRDGLNVQVSGTGSANVVVESSLFKSDSSEYQPQKAVDVVAGGSSSAQLSVSNSIISGMWNAGISATADSATAVNLSVHAFNNQLLDVALTSGANGIEVRSRGGGAHVVASRLISNNPIRIPADSNGIYLEPATGSVFNGVVTDNSIGIGVRAITTPGRGIVIDNVNGGALTPFSTFTINDNTIAGTASSGIALHMRNTTKGWYNLVQNNSLSNVNSGIGMPIGTVMPADEGMVFRLQNTGGGAPTYIMLITGNEVLNGRNIKLDNINQAGFFIVGSGGSAYDVIRRDNWTITPNIIGGIGVTAVYAAPNIQNQQPQAREDIVVVRANLPRVYDLLTNDTDEGGKMLVFVNPLGREAGEFLIDENATPDWQMDDLMVYHQPQPFLTDYTYYLMQDEHGWSRIAKVTTILGDPIFLPLAIR